MLVGFFFQFLILITLFEMVSKGCCLLTIQGGANGRHILLC